MPVTKTAKAKRTWVKLTRLIKLTQWLWTHSLSTSSSWCHYYNCFYQHDPEQESETGSAGRMSGPHYRPCWLKRQGDKDGPDVSCVCDDREGSLSPHQHAGEMNTIPAIVLSLPFRGHSVVIQRHLNVVNIWHTLASLLSSFPFWRQYEP